MSINLSSARRFFTRVDRVLRRSLGVSEHAKTDATVKPAPPVDPELPKEEVIPDFNNFPDYKDMFPDKGKGEQVAMGDNLNDGIKIELEEVEEIPEIQHDEL